MLERIRRMLIKELTQVFRDPKMRPIIFVIPVIQTLVFGYAVTTDIRQVATAVYDQDNTSESRELIERFVRSGYFKVVAHAQRPPEVDLLLDSGQAQAVLHLNTGFANELNAGRAAPLQVLLDGTDSNTAGVVLQYAIRITRQYSQAIQVQQQSRVRPPARLPQLELQSRAWFNENLESRNYYVPGVIALLTTLITLLLTSMAVVREKELGTLEQIMVTPLRRVEFILGKTLPFALIAFFDAAVVAALGVFWFKVPLRGSVPLLAAAIALHLTVTLGIGLLVSTVSRTQQQAMMTTFFFFLPAVLLSGFIYPIANMPEVVQWLTLADPLRYFLVILRGIFLKGVGFELLWPQFAGLVVSALVAFTLATLRFQKTLR